MNDHNNQAPFGLTQRDIDTLSGIFKKYVSVKRVDIFGSRAKGTHQPGSDIDLVIMNEGVGSTELLSIKNDLEESSLPYQVDLVSYHSIANKELMEHINRVGIPIYHRVVSKF